MIFLKKIIQNLRLLISKFLKVDLKLIKENIYKNQETPTYDSIYYLYKSKGVLHIGAHRGSERFVYDWLGKEVTWIESNPKIFRELEKNLIEFKYQKSYEALLHSKNGEIVDFFLSSNDNASSSIYDFSKDFKDNKLFFQNKKRNIAMTGKIKLRTCTLDDLILKHDIDIKKFNHWIIDVQGAELEVLKGAINSLKFCDSITVEVSTENFYEKGSKYDDVKEFLNEINFKVIKDPKRNHEDVVFIKNNLL